MPRDEATGWLTPGKVTHQLHVPADIPRPEYVGKLEPTPNTAGDRYNAEELGRIRKASRIAADALAKAGDAVAPGVTTDKLDHIVHEYIVKHGAYPSPLGYRGFPKSCCTSVNEVICHGIPDDTVLEDGDIVNIDVTAYFEGMHGDTNRTFLVGDVSEEAKELVARTYNATLRGIKAVAVGREVNVIGRTIEKYAKRFGYGVIRDYTGHGVGRAFHSGLVIPHYDAGDLYSDMIDEAMVFTVEPMLTLSGDTAWDLWPDDWTVTTRDHSLTAQFEHTLVVTEDGPEILTTF